jgi:hypothetical protein
MGLNRVDDIQPGFDEVGKKARSGAAAMQEAREIGDPF